MKENFRAKAGESFFNCMVEGTEEEIEGFKNNLKKRNEE